MSIFKVDLVSYNHTKLVTFFIGSIGFFCVDGDIIHKWSQFYFFLSNLDTFSFFSFDLIALTKTSKYNVEKKWWE